METETDRQINTGREKDRQTEKSPGKSECAGEPERERVSPRRPMLSVTRPTQDPTPILRPKDPSREKEDTEEGFESFRHPPSVTSTEG